MTLSRYTKPVDGTIPVPALLYEDEEHLSSQDGVGVYDGYVSPKPAMSSGVLDALFCILFLTLCMGFSVFVARYPNPAQSNARRMILLFMCFTAQMRCHDFRMGHD